MKDYLSPGRRASDLRYYIRTKGAIAITGQDERYETSNAVTKGWYSVLLPYSSRFISASQTHSRRLEYLSTEMLPTPFILGSFCCFTADFTNV